MIAKISLLGWSASGFRCPDHEVVLHPQGSGKPYPVTLIQMPNGTGKTTTLNLLRATLSGSAERWTTTQISAMQRTKDPASEGRFIVTLSIDDKRLTFELVLNYRTQSVSYRTTFGAGVRKGFYPPRVIERFLKPRFVDLFVFDGELAQNLTDSHHTRAREAIDVLFQLALFDGLAALFKRNWENHVAKVKIKGETGLTRRQNRLESLETRLKQLQREQKQKRNALNGSKETSEQIREEYVAALAKDKDAGKRLEQLRRELATAESLVSQKVDLTINEMRNPHYLSASFGYSLQLLKTNLDKLKLPSSTSKEFFEELADANECVCGRPLDNITRQAIRSRVKLYLGEDEAGVLNSIKSDIAKLCDETPDTYLSEHEGCLAELEEVLTRRDEFRTELDAIEQQRLAQGDAELEQKKLQLDKLTAQVETLQERLEELDRSPEGDEDDNTDCIKALIRLVAVARADVAEASSTVELSRRTDIAIQILRETQTAARQELCKLIVDDTNKRISELLVSDPVLVSEIQDSLILQGQGGASVGQTLSVGYAFLATLFGRSDYELPFVVDSPAGPLDLKVRPMVARLIPNLCKQFIAFTISSERDKFAEPLAEAASRKVQYLTIFRQTPVTVALPLIKASKSRKTRNGVIAEGKEFFNSFDVNEEGV
jgi:DNA sulfur modification protein DndD